MEYEEIRQIKMSEKSIVQLVREKGGEQIFIRKILRGRHPIYLTLQSYDHPFLTRLYDVAVSDDRTILIEEYVEGQSLGSAELTGKQLAEAINELCSILAYLHGKGIIHRDIKPSNILMAKDGHIRLIDFDAARMPKEGAEQDTVLLGTRGYAPPEQFGFSQTDERTDIYSLGVTMKQVLGYHALRPPFRRIIRKCTNLNPNHRYQSVRQVKRAIIREKYGRMLGAGAFFLVVCLCAGGVLWRWNAQKRTVPSAGVSEIQSYANMNERLGSTPAAQEREVLSENGQNTLRMPDNPHWDGETGIAVWGSVPESGDGVEDETYHIRVYRKDTTVPPDLEQDEWVFEWILSGDIISDPKTSLCSVSHAFAMEENGIYYFAVSAVRDDNSYAESPYAVSNAFVFTGESAPLLPAPTGLDWVFERGGYSVTWSNMDDYEDKDSFSIEVYDYEGNSVMGMIMRKEQIMREIGWPWIDLSALIEEGSSAYRFSVEVYSSRPNEYRSIQFPYSVPGERYSPWLYCDENLKPKQEEETD